MIMAGKENHAKKKFMVTEVDKTRTAVVVATEEDVVATNRIEVVDTTTVVVVAVDLIIAALVTKTKRLVVLFV